MNLYYVGVDVSKTTVDVAGWHENVGRSFGQFANHLDALEGLASEIDLVCQTSGAASIHLIIEPTGGYEFPFLQVAYQHGWQVSRPNPMHVRRWADGRGKRVKTDAQDALMLAEFGAANSPAPQKPVDDVIQQLDSLLRRRNDLESLQRAEENRLGQVQHKPNTPVAVRKSIERTIDSLDQERQAIDQAIHDLLQEHPNLRHQHRLLLSVPGIGAKTVLPLLVIFHRFLALTSGQGSPKQLVAYLGLDPRIHTSGRTVYKRPTISKMGDAQARKSLYMAALGGIRGRNALRLFYQRLVVRGKAKKVALVACARKILVWAWAVFTNDSPFDPSRYQPMAHIDP